MIVIAFLIRFDELKISPGIAMVRSTRQKDIS